MLKFVADCAPGSSIVFDYALQSFVDGDTRTYGGEQIARWLKKIGEPFLFGLYPARCAALPYANAVCVSSRTSDHRTWSACTSRHSAIARSGAHWVTCASSRRRSERLLTEQTNGRHFHRSSIQISNFNRPALRRAASTGRACGSASSRAKASSSACAEGARRKTGTLTGCFPRTPSTTAWAVSCMCCARRFPVATSKFPVRQSRAPSLMKRAAALLQMVAQKPVPAAAWKGYDANWSGRRPNAGSEFATMFFPQDVTRRLNAKARASGVSLNSLLMHTLAKASQPDLEDRSALVDDAREHARPRHSSTAIPPTRPAICRSPSPTARRSATFRTS